VGRRRCADCKTPLPLREPLVELATAILFAYLWGRYGPSVQLALFTLYTIVFILVFVIDWERRLILNIVMYPAILIAILGGFVRPDINSRLVLLGGLVGFILVMLIYLGGPAFVLLWRRLTGRTTKEVPFGLGDVTLGLFIGLVVGFPGVIFALFIGIFLAGLAALALIFWRAFVRRSYVALKAMPYGPFLVVGGMLMMLYGPSIMSAYFGAYQ